MRSRYPTYLPTLDFRHEMKMTDDQEKLLEDALGTVKVPYIVLTSLKFCKLHMQHYLRIKETVPSMRFSTSGFFRKSVVPGPLIHILKYFCHLLLFR